MRQHNSRVRPNAVLLRIRGFDLKKKNPQLKNQKPHLGLDKSTNLYQEQDLPWMPHSHRSCSITAANTRSASSIQLFFPPKQSDKSVNITTQIWMQKQSLYKALFFWKADKTVYLERVMFRESYEEIGAPEVRCWEDLRYSFLHAIADESHRRLERRAVAGEVEGFTGSAGGYGFAVEKWGSLEREREIWKWGEGILWGERGRVATWDSGVCLCLPVVRCVRFTVRAVPF